MKNIGENPAVSGVLRKMLFWCISFQILGITANFYAICVAKWSHQNNEQVWFNPLLRNKLSKFLILSGVLRWYFFSIKKDYSLFGLEIITQRVLHIMQQIWKF